jgi:catechol 2,3-dioxygenase-like lactoylglutathione lyase family enzyme
MSAAYARLRSFNVEYASSGPQRLPDWNPSAGGIEAFYFRDPDGHNLEVLAFPPDKGPAKWHVKNGRLFLGIDHTAIVVSDTEASLHFYRDMLGLRVVGTSDNYGSEQEHLNNVFGAHLRITTLRAAQGPGVEFLEYLAPRTGRSIPADTQADDLWYWQINMRGAGPESIVPAGTTPLHDGALGWNAGVIAHDPDGHASLIARDSNVTPK